MTFRVRVTSRNRKGRRVERSTVSFAYFSEAEPYAERLVKELHSSGLAGLRIALQTIDLHGHVLTSKNYWPLENGEKK